MSDDIDIVLRLRVVLHEDRRVELMNHEAADEIERQRKVLDWLLPQVFKRCHPEFDLGHPHMYVLSTAIKNENITDDMWKVIRRSLEGKP